jgi:uncharacterized membrane protein
MDPSTKRVLVWSGLIGGGIVIFVALLSIFGVFSPVYIFVFLIAAIIISCMIVAVVMLLKKKQDKEKGNEGKVMGEEEAERLAKEVYYKPDVLEYEKKLIQGGVGYFGKSGYEKPVYVRKALTYFEGIIIGIVVNMMTKQVKYRLYDNVKWDEEKIDEDILHMANTIVQRPAADLGREEEVIERPGGERVVRTRSYSREEEEAKEKEPEGLE